MKKKIPVALILLFSLAFLFACITVPDKGPGKKEKKDKIIKVPSGSNMPSLGMALDADYDKNTDGIIPGYKILTVAVTNNSMDITQFDVENDEWNVIDVQGRKHEAILDLRKSSPSEYSALPDKLKALIQYPIMVQVGETKVIDLLFKDHITLDGFRAVRFKNKISGRVIEIMAGE
jgi:hypothetical protein